MVVAPLIGVPPVATLYHLKVAPLTLVVAVNVGKPHCVALLVVAGAAGTGLTVIADADIVLKQLVVALVAVAE